MSSADENKPVKPQEHVEKATCSTEGFVTFVLGLVSGTFSALCCKFAYDTLSIGVDGVEKLFTKPIMMLLLMFIGMCPAIFFWLFQQSRLPPSERKSVDKQTLMILIIPSICDLLCTMLLLVAQLYITASLWQMMRGSIIIITALLKSFALQHRLRIHMWLGVVVITVAMVLVASTTFFSNTDSSAGATSKDPRVGVLLVVIGCLAQGVQYVFEEKVMNVNNAPPLVVIGFEGLWGTLLTLFVVYPLAYYLPGNDVGSFENPFDALMLIRNSTTLQWLVAFFLLFVTIYNCAAVYVTKYLSAIWHAILDNFRPITIWGVGLLIHAMGSQYGEVWVSASWLQLIGLIILLFGTAVYNGSVITFDDDVTPYQRIGDLEDDALPLALSSSGTGIIKTEASMASPALQRSPLIYRQLNAESVQRMGSSDDQRRAANRRSASGSLGSAPRGYQSLEMAGSANVSSGIASLEAGPPVVLPANNNNKKKAGSRP